MSYSNVEVVTDFDWSEGRKIAILFRRSLYAVNRNSKKFISEVEERMHIVGSANYHTEKQIAPLYKFLKSSKRLQVRVQQHQV